jgi:virginiamycin B lyase
VYTIVKPRTKYIALGAGSRLLGVIVGADGDAWVTDSGLNAIVRVEDETREVTVYPLPASHANANLNTAAFDARGVLRFTDQNGAIGRLDPLTGEMAVFESPCGRGPYGIAATAAGEVYFSSLAGSYVGGIDTETDVITVIDPPTLGQGARRVWPDSGGRIWVSEWNAGAVAVYDPETGEWQEWDLPGTAPRAYSLYVDELDQVWLSDFGANTILRFDPESQSFESFALFGSPANVRQLLGREGEVWGAESADDQLVVVRY